MAAATRSPAKLTRKDFQRLAELRAQEAALLARSRKHQGAYYLGGLAVECALKACIAKRFRRYDFPDKGYVAAVHSHNLEELLKLAELLDHLDQDVKKRPQLANSWGVIKRWDIDSRYEVSGLSGKDMANAVNSQADGMLAWIKQRW